MQPTPDLAKFFQINSCEARFNANRNNFFNLIKKEVIELMVPDLFMDDSDNSEITEEQKDFKK